MTRLAIAAFLVAACTGDNNVEGPACGDGVVDRGEECDDGNNARGDGCFECLIAPAVCGNGVLDIGEDCDDSNVVSGDGCSATCEPEIPERFITATWVFKNLQGDVTTTCPTGVTQVELEITPVSGEGKPVITTFACADGSGVSSVIGPGRYRVLIRALAGAAVHAVSLADEVDASLGDGTYATTIYNDAGYFSADWTLRGALSQMVFTCNQIGAASVRATITGPTASSPIFSCASGTGVTAPLLAGSYAVSWQALDAGMNLLGTLALTNLTVTAPNAITAIGAIEIPLDNF